MVTVSTDIWSHMLFLPTQGEVLNFLALASAIYDVTK